mmetsp:Transcript_30569/g.66161  ORF Transcript_30569/g.66161 Transcript_30569/m.66161 type:complete len:80 (-) Transcript_30569:295-534(-)
MVRTTIVDESVREGGVPLKPAWSWRCDEVGQRHGICGVPMRRHLQNDPEPRHDRALQHFASADRTILSDRPGAEMVWEG